MRNALWNHYECRDGKWIAIAYTEPERYWSAFLRAMGLEELEHDPRFEVLEARGENAPELISILDEKFATKTRDEWVEFLGRRA